MSGGEAGSQLRTGFFFRFDTFRACRRHNRKIFIMARASARHILVPDEATCLKLKADIEAGTDFADVAKEHSQCPSGQRGGDLGEFGQGQMVPEFDKVVFNDEVNVVHGPVQTQFGYHLLEITSRSE